MKPFFLTALLLLITICINPSFASNQENAAGLLYNYGISKLLPSQTNFDETITRYTASLLLLRFAGRINAKLDHHNDCTFYDLQELAQSDANEITNACNLGLFKGYQGSFRPFDSITRGEVITVLARILLQNSTINESQAIQELVNHGLIEISMESHAHHSISRANLYLLLYDILSGIGKNTLFSQFSITNTVQSVNTDKTKEVLQIIAYEKDKVFGNFKQIQKGSAVYLGNNLLVTNAHVVLDEDNKATHLYEICNYNVANNKTECKTYAKLLQYNKDEDLALLEIDPQKSLAFSAATFSSNAPKSNDSVTVYGFPGIGGNSITVTKGIISGIETEQYKSDVKIDHGNSGGGAYNKQGELIGIPSSVRSDADTLSYIIPYTKVAQFLNSQGNIVKITTPFERQDFINYLDTLQFVKSSDTIKNPVFSLTPPRGRNITDYSFSENMNLYTVSLTNSNQTIEVSINNGFSSGSALVSQAEYSKELKQLENYCNTIVTGNIMLQGVEFSLFECQELFGQTYTIKSYSYDNDNLSFAINVSIKTDDAVVLSQVDDLIKNINFSHTLRSSVSEKLGNIVTIPVLTEGTLQQSIQEGGAITIAQNYIYQDKQLNLTPKLKYITKDDFVRQTKNKTYKDLVITKTSNFYKDYYDTLYTGSIIKNNNNHPGFFEASKSKADQLEEGEEIERNYNYSTYIQTASSEIYLLDLSYSYHGEQDKNFETKILQHLNSIAVHGTFPMTNIGIEPMIMSSISFQP